MANPPVVRIGQAVWSADSTTLIFSATPNNFPGSDVPPALESVSAGGTTPLTLANGLGRFDFQ